MWGLAAAFGPVGWVVAAVGTAATVYAATSSTDEYETSTYSNRSEKEAEVREHTRTDKRNRIKKEIKAYKSKQIKRLKDKYDVNVEFSNATIGSAPKSSLFQSILFNIPMDTTAPMNKDIFEKKTIEKIKINKKDVVDSISVLEQETAEILKLIEKLEVAKHETTR